MATRYRKSLLSVMALLLSVAFGAAPANAAQAGAGLSGRVVNSLGKPQFGAVVEVFTAAAVQPVRLYTDPKGFYSVANLLPGTYFIKATADTFLPSIRENVNLQAGSHLMINITLNTLFEAFQMLPAPKHADKDDDEWRWTLRSAANRPILRVLDENTPLVVVSKSENGDDRVLKAKVAFMAGSDGASFSGSDVKTAFKVEQSIFSTGTVSLGGNFGYNAGQTNGVLRAAYKQETGSGSHPEFALTVARFATPDNALRHAALSALALSGSDGFTVADFLEFNYGGELQAIQFRGRVHAFRPFGSVSAHLSENTLLQYRYATSMPDTRAEKGFDSAPADLSETNPRVSLQNDAPQLESAQHHEVALSQRAGKNNFQAAYFIDRVRRAALNGVGEIDSDFSSNPGARNFLPDIYSGTFTYTGGDVDTQGLRLVAERKIAEALTATVDYSYGGALTVDGDGLVLDPLQTSLHMQNRHSLTSKFAGNIPRSKTRWIASYKWTSGDGVLTPVDMFNASAGRSDPYLNIFIRQPLPGGFLPGRVEALIDVRNLLSQGYVPFVGPDGRTLYLVQSARAIRGGLAFNF